jgi:protein-arginine kinase activator protein McsA
MSIVAQVIRCPVCCAKFDGRQNTPEFDAFFRTHQTCKGQTFVCGCEWERLCDGTTLLVRVAPPCPKCATEFPDGSCLKCPGCAECKPEKATSTSPLGLRVTAGLEDDRLLHHLAELERCEATSARGLSDGEERLRNTIWKRLDEVTRS